MSKEKKSIPASTLKSIDDLNPAFDMPVDVKLKSGQAIQITLKCQALEKLQWAEIRDKANDEARARSEARIEAASEDDAKPIRITEVVRDTMAAEASLVVQFATGWDLADEFNEDSLKRLENKCGGAMGAMISKYEVAIYQGRLGN